MPATSTTVDRLDLSAYQRPSGSFRAWTWDGPDADPLFYLDADLAIVCDNCADSSTVGVGINRDDERMRCSACDARIPSTYGEPFNLG